ncbi:hypothetical protein PoB_005304500 [Plakobranchus ocellatus]|uniref:Uncharacterized protein n=1 Tax=Plakobranchus ocellatus TaxID=259542 RepID=A0AAV4C4I9_9GAST|nr:hypothetical protein PoB_005304500 [Plakobranchus ocellatus]
MQKDKEVGRKKTRGWGRLAEPDRSRRQKSLPIAVTELTCMSRTNAEKAKEKRKKGMRKVGHPDQSRAAVGFIQRQPYQNYSRFGISK